ncbi:MAG: zinc ribbon domain-containing protein [Gemmatimonadota bacterium]|nr:zinc ribbon domain-containing protein [Gemmatimonadota bacterium]
MPTYVYECPSCGHEFERFLKKMDDRARTRKCPSCGKRARRRISGGAGFLFKGEGFYATDYRSEEYRSKAESERKKASGGPSDAKDSGSSETEGKNAADGGGGDGANGS